MARLALLTTSLLSTLALAFSDGLLDARQGTACSARGQALSRCLGSAGTAFCSALLAQTTIAANTTTTTTVTNALGTSTITASPAVTTTVSGGVTTLTTTLTSFANNTLVTGIDTWFVATITANTTITSTIRTCPSPAGAGSNITVPGPSNAAITPTPSSATQSISITTTLESLAKRQAASSISATASACYYNSFVPRYGVDAAFTLCRNCYGVAFPSPATITASTVETVTQTLNVVMLTVTTPTITVTSYQTSIVNSNILVTSTVNTAAISNATTTVTSTSTTTMTACSPTPSNFVVFFTNSTDGTSSFGRAVRWADGAGTVIQFGGPADTFTIDDQARLDDVTSSGFIAKNSVNTWPTLFVIGSNGTAATVNTPLCAGCNGTLSCNYPGDSGDVWALCDGFLALGRSVDFKSPPQPSQPPCTVITNGLQFR